MKSRFESTAWLAAIARLVGNDDADASANALVDAVAVAVEHEGTCLLVFHRDAPPEVLHHTLGAALERASRGTLRYSDFTPSSCCGFSAASQRALMSKKSLN